MDEYSAKRDEPTVKKYISTVLNAISDSVFFYDLNGKVLEVNEKVLQMFGCTREEANCLRLREFWVSGAPVEDMPVYWKKAISGEDQQFEHRLRRPKDGLVFDAEISLKGLSLPEGDYILAVVRDITERKRVEEELKAAQDFLRTALNSTYDAIYLHDSEGKIIQVNDRMLQSHGAKSREEVIGLSIQDVSDPKSPFDELKKRWSKVLAGDNQFHEWTGKRLTDGSLFPVEVYLTKVSLHNVDYILANVRDITERKKIEDLLIKEKQRFKDVAESSPIGKAMIEGDGDEPHFGYVNPKFKEIFGYTLDEEPQLADWLKVVGTDPKREMEMNWSVFQRLMRELMTPSGKRITFKDGRIKYVTFLPSQLETGEMLIACEDVTVREEVQEKIKQHNLELEILNNLIASVSRSLHLPQIGDTIKTIFAERLAMDAGAIFFYDSLNSKFTMKTSWGISDVSPHEFETFALYCYLNANPTGEKGIIITQDRISFPEGTSERMRRKGWDGYLCLSFFHEGEFQGMVFLVVKDYAKFGEDSIAFLEAIARQIGVAIQNARLFQQVQQSHAELKALSLRLVNAQEAVRSYVARELHDEVGQVLTGLKLVLEMHALECEGKTTERLAEAMTTVNSLHTFVRELSLNLRPAVLDVLGLFHTLPWHFKRYSLKTNISVSFHHTNVEDKRFPVETETAVYRIVQEALTNVARHAQVTEVAVRLWFEDKTLKVQIEDKGAGFDAEAVLRAANTSGLNGMRERAILLGGHFTIETHPGHGTRLTAELPAE